MLNVSGHADLTNCTISGNRGVADDDGDPGDRSGGGGVVLSGGTVSLRNCTVSFNEGWGLRAGRGSVITNTIISNNLLGDCASYDDIDFGYNVFGDGGCVMTATSISGDPSLGPLADNGGTTLTHALLPGSIAINAGDCAGGTVTTDQRGVSRPRGGACDIGAFEFVPPPPQVQRSSQPIQ